MNKQPGFSKKCTDLMLYLSSMERRNFMKLKKTQLFYLAIKLMKPFAVPRACTKWKTKRGTLVFSRISSEPLESISNKHNCKTFSKSPTASLSHCIGNIFSHSSGKWSDSLIMAALSFTTSD